MKNILLTIAIVFGLCGAASAQTALTQTTLAAAITVGTAGGASGITGSYSTQLSLTSATGIQVANNGQPITFVYIDQELFGVLTLVTGQTTIYNVLRAQLGTRAAGHSLGAMALIEVVSPQFGGYSGSGGFQQADPPGGLGASCTATNTLATPWVNVLTGWQWICSVQSSTWTPGFNNPLLPVAPIQNGPLSAAASGAQAVPSTVFSLSGTNAITSFTLPVGCGGQTPVATSTAGTCMFGIIPTGAYTTTATNNIASASTAVVGHIQWWTYNPVTQKFASSY
jgi:hypothetical protein